MEEEENISAGYKQSRKLVLTLQHQLEQLESGEDTTVFLQGRIATNVNTLSRLTQNLMVLINQLSHPKREIWDIKIKQLVEDEQNIRRSMESFFLKEHKRHEEEQRKVERERLLGSSYSNDVIRENTRETLHKDILSLSNSNRVAHELKEMAIGIVEKLREQNWTLKRAKRRLLDISNTLGLSHSIMRLIERRQFGDQIIVYSGMIFILVLFVSLVYYFG